MPRGRKRKYAVKKAISLLFEGEDYLRIKNAVDWMNEQHGGKLFTVSYLCKYFIMRGIEEFENKIGEV